MKIETIILQEVSDKLILRSRVDVYDFVSSAYKVEEREQIVLLTLDDSGCLLGSHLIQIGKIANDTIDMKNLMLKAITDNAASIIVCFIKSSSSKVLGPQFVDTERANKIFEAATIMNIRINFQLIIGKSGYINIEPSLK